MSYFIDFSLGALSFALIFILLFGIAILSFLLIASWKVFVKLGRPGWQGLIPIWNICVLSKECLGSYWWVLMCLFPGAALVFSILIMIQLCRGFDFELLLTVILIVIPLASLVGYGVMAFSNIEWTYKPLFGEKQEKEERTSCE